MLCYQFDICGTVPFLPGYYWQLKEKKKGIFGAVWFLFNFHFLYSFSLLKSCIHFLLFLFGTDFGLVFVFLKSFYFLTKLTVTRNGSSPSLNPATTPHDLLMVNITNLEVHFLMNLSRRFLIIMVYGVILDFDWLSGDVEGDA